MSPSRTEPDRLLWVDLETSALEPGELHQIASVVTDKNGDRLGPVLNARIKLEFPDLADPAALAIGGYQPDGRFDAPESVCEYLNAHMRTAYFAGHNAHFDYGFTKQFLAQYQGCGADDDLVKASPHHLCCTASLAMPLWVKGTVPNVSLKTLCDHFGISFRRTGFTHDALDDIEATIQLYKKLIAL